MGNEGELEEYLVFAATTGSVATVEGGDFVVTQGSCRIPVNGSESCNSLDEDDTLPVFLTGIVAFMNDSTLVTGLGTNFVSELSTDATIIFEDSFGTEYAVTVAEVLDIDSLTLTEPFELYMPEGEVVPEALEVVAQVLAPLTASSRVILTDDGGRTISGVAYINVRRGDWSDDWDDVTLSVADGNISCPAPNSGVIYVEDTVFNRGVLSPTENSVAGLSHKRGDRVTEVGYYLSPPKFWWTRNDPSQTRFGFSGKDQRWAPYKGGPIKNLGRLDAEKATTQLAPRPKNLVVGDYLVGTQIPDSVAMVRLGVRPDAGSIPLGDDEAGTIGFRGILVVPDSIIDDATYDFSVLDPAPVGIVGDKNGIIQWHPGVFAQYAGQTIWYIQDIFESESEGEVGKILGTDLEPLFISPIPSSTERPLLKIGNRQWLDVQFADNDQQLGDSIINTGQVGVSLTTGQIKLSAADITKADMGEVDAPNDDFEPLWSGATLYYDGVAMCRVAQPLKAPALVTDEFTESDGYNAPVAIPVPGLGVSGIRIEEDKTGREPNFSQVVGRRPGKSGVVRKCRGVGDTFLFNPNKAFEDLVVKKDPDDLDGVFGPSLTQVYTTYGSSNHGGAETSPLVFNRSAPNQDERQGLPLYFQNTDFTPAFYASDIRMFSRKDGPYALRGDEVLQLVVGGSHYKIWEALSLTEEVTVDPDTYTAKEVSESINLILDGSGYEAGYIGNRLFLTATSGEGMIEILPGVDGEKDFSGCAALGFNPFWKTSYPLTDVNLAGTSLDLNWLPDTGGCIGFKRTPFNKGNDDGTPDFRATNRIESLYLGDVGGSPYMFLQQAPLEDVAGVDEGVFFEIFDGPYQRSLVHMEDILHQFGIGRFVWLGSRAVAFQTKTPVSTISFGVQGVVPESLHPALKGFFLSRDPGTDGYKYQTDGEDYLFPQEGATGNAILIQEIGALLSLGAKGTFDEGGNVFTDDSAGPEGVGFNAIPDIAIGARLKVLTGDSVGSYLIEAFDEDTLTVWPNFPSDSDGVVSWEVYSLRTPDEIDDQLSVDYVYKRFNHMPRETFQIHLLSPVGVIGTDALIANVSQDLARERRVRIRFGLHHTLIESEVDGLSYFAPRAAVRWLETTELGLLANASLFLTSNHIPDDTHLASGDYRLRIATLLIASDELVEVPTSDDFSEDPTGVEITADTRELKFSSQILDDYGQAIVIYEETLFPPELLEAGKAEVNSVDGTIALSEIDIANNMGEQVYWDSRMVTEDQTDVFLNPMAGAFMFREQLLEWQIVEATYQTTNAAGELLKDDDDNILPEIVEFLPLHVRAEECEKVNNTTFKFNPTGRTVRQDIEPIIYVGPEMASEYGPIIASVDYETNEITLEYDVPDLPEAVLSDPLDPDSPIIETTPVWDGTYAATLAGRKVTITYAVLEAFGGESVYTVSAPPVYRPPFFLDGKVSSFELLEDRSADLHPGQLMRLGSFLFYLKAVAYDAETDLTTVTFYPESPSSGAGSRAPGNDVLSLITEWPVAREVDPSDPVVISEDPSGNLWGNTASSPHGFLVPIGERLVFGNPDEPEPSNVGFEPTPKTRGEVIFFANLIEALGQGFLIEIGGSPHTITGLALSEDGTRTTVSITPPLPKGILYGDDEVLVSTRPIYPPDDTTYLGFGRPFLASEETDVVLWGEVDKFGTTLPGRTMTPFQDYIADPQTGDIDFQYPIQQYIQSDQRLTFRRIRIRVVKPKMVEGYPQFPTFNLRYLHEVAPSEGNGLLGNLLMGTYSYHTPDSFYYRAIPLLDFAGEAATEIIKKAAAKQSSYGSTLAVGGDKNWENGRVGIKVEQDHLYDTDRAARAYLSFFNEVCVGFEQISEAATGRIVGDRDGKFRFWVGEGLEYTPPGFTNPVSGKLNPRYAYGRAFLRFMPPDTDVIVDEDDLIVDPTDFSIDSAEELDGVMPSSDWRELLIDNQMEYIKNDVDDRVVIGFRVSGIRWRFPGWPQIEIKGRIRSMEETHYLSRIFPNKANYFTTTYPGLGADPKNMDFGTYSFLKIMDWKLRSTFLSTIGQVENPVIGPITNVTDTTMRPRTARARVFRYSIIGFPELDEELFDGGVADPNSFSEIPRPAVIASVVDLPDFPLKEGWPNIASFATTDPENGLPDLNTGNWEDHVPPWAVGMRLQFGHPNGDMVVPKYNEKTGWGPNEEFKELFVGEIIKGCVMTFASGDIITNPNMIIDPANNEEPITLAHSDTLVMLVGDGVSTEGVDPDDPSFSDLGAYASSLPTYREGFDYTVSGSGRIRDLTFPEWSTPMLGIHEMFGQHGPNPHQRIEGDADFYNSSLTPLAIPALKGETRDDSGDYTLPYMKSTNTELVRLREAMASVIAIMQQDSTFTPLPHVWKSVYPDEIFNTAFPLAEADGSGLKLEADAAPVGGTYEDGSGLGDLRAGDLVLIETDQGAPLPAPAGVQGFLSVGGYTVHGEEPDRYSVISVPRFVTRSKPETPINYEINRAMATMGNFESDAIYVESGLRVRETVVNGSDPLFPHEQGYTETRLEFEIIGFNVDDGAANDTTPFGSGYYDPSSGTPGYDVATGGLNDLLAQAEVGTKLTFQLLQRATLIEDPGPPITYSYEPDALAGDGSVLLTLDVVKVTMGDDPELMGGAGAAHVFQLEIDGSPIGYIQTPDGVGGTLHEQWLYTTNDSPSAVMVIRTYHPEAPEQYSDPFPPGHPDEGLANPDHDPNAVSSWFDWTRFVHIDLTDNLPYEINDGSGDPSIAPFIPRERYTWGHAEVWEGDIIDHSPAIVSDFADAYEEVLMSVEVIDGVNAYIDSDRLTFTCPVDVRNGKVRGTTHPISEINLEMDLNVSKVTGQAIETDSDYFNWIGLPVEIPLNVNDMAHVNGGVPFTFLPRHDWMTDIDPDNIPAGEEPPTIDGVGYWRTGYGVLRVMGFEAHGNVPITFTEAAKTAAIPSSDLTPTSLVIPPNLPEGRYGDMLWHQDADADPLTGSSSFPNRISTYSMDETMPYLNDPDECSFKCPEVEAGDVVYIQTGPGEYASTKVGTYLVRYGLDPQNHSDGKNLTPAGGTFYPDPAWEGTGTINGQKAPMRPVRASEETVNWNTNDGWLDLRVPAITAFDEANDILTVSGLRTFDGAPTTNGTSWLDPGGVGLFEAYLYILFENPTDSMNQTDLDEAVLRCEYTAIDAAAGTFTLDLDTAKGGGGTVLSYEDAKELVIASVGKNITGAKFFPINIKHPNTTKYPDIRLSGHDWSELPDDPNPRATDLGVDGLREHRAIRGFVDIQLQNEDMAYGDTQTWTAHGDGDYEPPLPYDGLYNRARIRKHDWMGVNPDKGPEGHILVGKTPATGWVHGEFQEDENALAAYETIPTYIDISFLSLGGEFGINDPTASVANNCLNCLLPGTVFNATFWAEAGVFLEPNFPRPTFDLGRATRSVVCDDNGTVPATEESLDPNEVGERTVLDFIADEDGDTVPDYPFDHFVERVQFSVRRIRRFHNYVLDPLSDAMKGLRFAYETRRSECVSYTQGYTFGKLIVKPPPDAEDITGWGTQLGPLTDDDVNINVGDIVRVMNTTTGELRGWGEISKVEGTLEDIGAGWLQGTEIQIGPPGFVGDDPIAGDQLEIYLFRPPVPHQQSNEQLLELATEEIIMTRRAALGPGNDENGYPAAGGIVKWDASSLPVPEPGDPPHPNTDIYGASVNFLTDTNAGLEDGQINFQSEGIEEGDYLLIDPAGEVEGWDNTQEQPDPVEEGLRPFGDIGTAVSEADGYEKGYPGELDDNRGYYKIEKIEETRVQVSPNRLGASELIGSSGQPNPIDKLHGGGSTPLNFFALYPTISASSLSGEIDPLDGTANGREGQGDLRPTAFAGEDPHQGLWANGGPAWDEPGGETGVPPHNSFKETPFSIGPFSYKVIRPTKFLKDDTVEMILFHRERILSLMENFEGAMRGDKSGTYWDFQNERHSFDLGDPTIPDTGLGVPRNNFLYGLAGQYQYAPFLNDSDCLSALDRRVILEDILLDIEHPPNDTPDPFYTKFSEEDGFPLLLGRIDQILDKTDRIRQKRLAWLFLRTTKTDGTLANIRNWKAQLVERLIERERMRRLQESMGG